MLDKAGYLSASLHIEDFKFGLCHSILIKYMGVFSCEDILLCLVC